MTVQNKVKMEYAIKFENVKVISSFNGIPKYKTDRQFPGWDSHAFGIYLGKEGDAKLEKIKKEMQEVIELYKSELKEAGQYADFDVKTNKGNFFVNPFYEKETEYYLYMTTSNFYDYDKKHDKAIKYGYKEIYELNLVDEKTGETSSKKLTKSIVANPSVLYQGEINEDYNFPWKGDTIDVVILFQPFNKGREYKLRAITKEINILKREITPKGETVVKVIGKPDQRYQQDAKTVKSPSGSVKLTKKPEVDKSIDELSDLSDIDSMITESSEANIEDLGW